MRICPVYILRFPSESEQLCSELNQGNFTWQVSVGQNEQQTGLTRAQVTDGHRDLATKDNAQGT